MSNPRFLAVKAATSRRVSPAQQIEALRRWNPTRYRELKVFLHSDLPSNPTPANFEKLKNAPGNASVRSFVAATQKLSPDLQISKEEAKKFSARSRRRRRRHTCISRGVLGRCADCADEKLRVRRNVRTTAVRSRWSVYSGERRSKRIVARARERSAISFPGCLEPQELDAALVRSSRNCIGSFSMWMIKA